MKFNNTEFDDVDIDDTEIEMYENKTYNNKSYQNDVPKNEIYRAKSPKSEKRIRFEMNREDWESSVTIIICLMFFIMITAIGWSVYRDRDHRYSDSICYVNNTIIRDICAGNEYRDYCFQGHWAIKEDHHIGYLYTMHAKHYYPKYTFKRAEDIREKLDKHPVGSTDKCVYNNKNDELQWNRSKKLNNWFISFVVACSTLGVGILCILKCCIHFKPI